jgi:hypothetical protein
MTNPNAKLRVLAFYLPQYHPIPENDEWWGKGFTEWTNVAKSQPLFRGHYQPKVPTELGFYDLRMSEVREEQARLAFESGIEGFVYWHYWFGNGKRLLERPFNEVLSSGKPDYPFCLAWANISWVNATWQKGLSKKDGQRVIAEQLYPGEKDYQNHFYSMLPAFKDKRYIKVDGCPIFFIYVPEDSAIREFITTWRLLAKKEGLKNFHFVAIARMGSLREKVIPQKKIDELLAMGFDAVNTWTYTRAEIEANKYKKYIHTILGKVFHINVVSKIKQSIINKHLYLKEDKGENVYPLLFPNWDCAPRKGKNCTIYTESTPKVFAEQIKKVKELLAGKLPEHRIAILKSWNEWGEGNYVEPDIKYGRGYLDVLRKELIGNIE